MSATFIARGLNRALPWPLYIHTGCLNKCDSQLSCYTLFSMEHSEQFVE